MNRRGAAPGAVRRGRETEREREREKEEEKEEKRVKRAKARLSRGQRHTEPGSVKRQCPLSVWRTCAGQVSV